MCVKSSQDASIFDYCSAERQGIFYHGVRGVHDLKLRNAVTRSYPRLPAVECGYPRRQRKNARVRDCETGRAGSDILDFGFLIPEWEIFAVKGRKENKENKGNLTGKKREKAGKGGKVWEGEEE